HSTSFDPQAVKQQLGIAMSTWDVIMHHMHVLSERSVKSEEARDYFAQVFTGQDKEGQANERAMAKVTALINGQAMGAELASAKGMAFGLLNAVTAFVDYERRAKTPDHRLDSAWFCQRSEERR